MGETDDEDDPNPEVTAVLQGVAQRITAIRTATNLTQSKLGTLAQLRPSQVFELESGRANITLKTLTRVASALGVSASDLIPHSGDGVLSPESIEHLLATFERVRQALEQRHAQDAALLREMDVLANLRLTLAKTVPGGEKKGPSTAAEVPARAPTVRKRATKPH